ncbi:RED-like protein N-terminal region-domain-containing protein [Chytriomyces sp. MP71]|nr:RED-like protein N-terminal region-domain-containing protein [Chytriomyces sp. MP71]
MSLSQNDFRKLLATPRPQSSGAEAAKPAKFAKPAPPQRKPANDSARIVPAKFRKKPDPETEDGPKFRDRAKERRQGNNPDFADSEDILARLTAIEEREQGENADIKTALYQQSKYLGGDEKHTHLVKGLDFALLKKVRSEMQKTDDQATKEQEAEEYLERVANETVAATSSKPIFNSGFAELIHTAAMDANAKMIPQKNELFRAGRMAFCWDLRGDDIPTTVIRSKAEVKDELKPSTADSEIVIGKIVEILASVRLGTRNKESMTAGEKKALKKKEREEKLKAELEGTEAAYADAMDDGDE